MTETLPTPTPDATELQVPSDGGSVPRRFGRYQIEQVTGKGAMGWVVLARDLTLQRPVALKLFHVSGTEDVQRKVKKRYVDEARSAAALVHPHILQIYEVGLFEGWVFIAMEVLPGGDLRDQVRARGPMGWHEACTLIQQAADGLSYAHQQGMIHRDIKPANLMRTQRGDCKVVDFGLTTRVDAPIGEPGAGTPNYQSPESARGHNGPQNDVWGLAASLWFLLTGMPPFALDKPKDVLKIHDALLLPDLRTLRPDVPEPVVRVIEQALAKNPGERFHLAEDFGRVLQLAVAHATRSSTDPMPPAFTRPVNPDLVELASAMGDVDPSGSALSHSRSMSHAQQGHARRKEATPVWVYGLIAFLATAALVGTALLLMQGNSGRPAPTQTGQNGGASAGEGMADGQQPAPLSPSDASADNASQGHATADRRRSDDGDAPRSDAVTSADVDSDHLTEQFGVKPGLTETINGVAITASSADAASPPGLAIDGDRDTAWRSDSKGWGRNTLTLDLGEPVMLESVTVYWGDPLPRQVVIHISVDGDLWTVFSKPHAVDDREDAHRPLFMEEARFITIETRGEPAGEPDIRVREIDLVYE
ncbi:protein kinase [Phycisphaeraceae bacterium D3-23]